MAFGRKRVYANAFRTVRRTPFKRRRIIRSNRFRGRKSSQYSSAAGFASGIKFKSRKIRPRQFRKILWRDTQALQHYRSMGAGSGAISTPVGSSTMTVATVDAMDNGINSFWTATGGTLTPDTGVAVPIFRGNITVRGGMVGLRIYNDGAYSAHVQVYLVRQVPRPVAGTITSPVPVGFDPSGYPDFSKDFGKIITSRRMLIRALDVVSIEKRIWPMKIDQYNWATEASRLVWIIFAADADVTGQDNIRTVNYFNVSFSADAIGTT